MRAGTMHLGEKGLGEREGGREIEISCTASQKERRTGASVGAGHAGKDDATGGKGPRGSKEIEGWARVLVRHVTPPCGRDGRLPPEPPKLAPATPHRHTRPAGSSVRCPLPPCGDTRQLQRQSTIHPLWFVNRPPHPTAHHTQPPTTPNRPQSVTPRCKAAPTTTPTSSTRGGTTTSGQPSRCACKCTRK